MRQQIADYRARAIRLHAQLLELEVAGNDNIAPLRRALIESSVRIEDVARALVGTGPVRWPHATQSHAALAEQDNDDWLDVPTLRCR